MTRNTSLDTIDASNGFSQSVPIDNNESLQLSVINASGEVHIESSDHGDIQVFVRRSDGATGDISNHIPVTVSANGNTVSIHPEWALAGGFGQFTKKVRAQIQAGLNTGDWDFSGLRLNADLDYAMRILVPKTISDGSRITVKTASGRVAIRDLAATISATTASAPIAINQIAGTVSVHSASGPITVGDVRGSLEANTASGVITVTNGDAWTALRTVSGAIHVDGSTLRNARIMTVSGNIDIFAIASNSQDYSFETVSGSIALRTTVPATALSHLSFKTISGSEAIGGDWLLRHKRSWVAGAGESGPKLAVKSVSGPLTAHARCDSATQPRHEALPGIPPPNVEAGPGSGLNGEPNDLEKGVEAATAWIKDFARGLQSTDEINTDSSVKDTQPISTDDQPQQASSSSPWVWSTGSGAPPPANTTTPLVSHDSTDRIAPPPTSRSESDRLQLLEALERGEIGVDEALARLDSTDADPSTA